MRGGSLEKNMGNPSMAGERPVLCAVYNKCIGYVGSELSHKIVIVLSIENRPSFICSSCKCRITHLDCKIVSMYPVMCSNLRKNNICTCSLGNPRDKLALLETRNSRFKNDFEL